MIVLDIVRYIISSILIACWNLEEEYMSKINGDEAVFARNHREYMDYAVEVGKLDPRSQVTFRSQQSWSGAEKLLKENDDLPIYFGVVGEDSEVLYMAYLRQVLINPVPDDEKTTQFLQVAPPSTEEEGLWDGKVKTLYTISGCHLLENSFPMTSLIKLSDNEPISPNFNYSYSLVKKKSETPSRNNLATDISEPASRIETRVNRIIRDTSLIQNLKMLHNGQCQLCNLRLDLPDGSAYSEGHHLQPLGKPHNGPDVPENVLILCPNCHALLDLAAIHIDIANLKVNSQHPIGQQFISYHNAKVQKKRVKQV